MKVKEVINKCEELLAVESTKECLLYCFNLVENELALDYLPLYATQYCNSNMVNYTEFEYNPIRIVGCNCKFRIYPTYIESQEIMTEIKYTYVPNNKELYDECSYNQNVLDCLAYGTIAEYFIQQGFYEEAAAWNKKYKKEIELLML